MDSYLVHGKEKMTFRFYKPVCGHSRKTYIHVHEHMILACGKKTQKHYLRILKKLENYPLLFHILHPA